MKCDFCDQKASVFLTQFISGETKEICLCEQCAEERGITDSSAFGLADMLLAGAKAAAKEIAGKMQTSGAGAAPSSGKSAAVCPSCGFTLEDLHRVRRFGCGDCYHAFPEEVSQILHGMHKGASHVGKFPAGQMEMRIRHQRLEELRSRLDQAIAAENYEEAVGIRDEIRSLDLATPS